MRQPTRETPVERRLDHLGVGWSADRSAWSPPTAHAGAMPHRTRRCPSARFSAPPGAGHDLFGQRGIVAIEVMATAGLDPLGPVEFGRRAGGVVSSAP